MFNYINNIVSTYKENKKKRYEELSKKYLEEAVEALKNHDDKLYDEYHKLYWNYKLKARAIA